MQTKFKDIAQYYFGTGLLLKYNNFSTNRCLTAFLTGVNNTEIETTYKRKVKGCHGDIISFNGRNNIKNLDLKPLLRSLDSLTKPITVKGYNDDKEFVPLDELNKVLWYTDVCIVNFVNSGLGYRINDGAQTALSFRDDVLPILSLLLKWHFNIFNLHETEYIKID